MVTHILRAPYILRPANYPKGTPGRGWWMYERNGMKICVITLLGQSGFNRIHLSNPFHLLPDLIARIKQETNIIVLDFHASTTAEKTTMFYFMDGKVSAVIGTHFKVLTADEAIFSIREKLYEPLRLAADCGVKILLEPHGEYTDSIEWMEKILDACNSDALGVNMDTGNSWLGGADPVEMVKRLGSKIEHVHWKDMPAEMEAQRGDIFGCGMAVIPLGSGVVDIKGVYDALVAAGFDGYTTLEIAGDDAVLASYEYLKSLGAE